MSELLLSQKNHLLELIMKAGFDPFNFVWRTHRLNKGNHEYIIVPELSYKDSPYFFRFDDFNGEHYPIYSPGGMKLVERPDPRLNMHWMMAESHFHKWLSYLGREISQTDRWTELSKYTLSTGIIIDPSQGNTPFSYAEVIRIQEGIKRIEKLLQEQFEMTKEQSTFVAGRLSYLEDAAKRQGRNDWLHTSIGVMFTILMTLQASQEQANQLFQALKDVLKDILRLLVQ